MLDLGPDRFRLATSLGVRLVIQPHGQDTSRIRCAGMSAFGQKQTLPSALDSALGSSPLGFDPREEAEPWHPKSVVRDHRALRGWPGLNCVDSELTRLLH